MNIQALTLKDGYKIDHPHQFPNIDLSLNNFTARKSRNPNIKYIVYYGLQGFTKEWLIDHYNRTFFSIEKEVAVNKYRRRLKNNGIDIDLTHIEKLWDMRYLPIEIWSLPEGSLVPLGVPLYVAFNTHKDFFWLPGSLETVASCEMWKPTTSATMAREAYKIFKKWSDLTCDNDNHVKYQGWDFSARGMSGIWDAMVSGSGHLLSFEGSDTVCAVDYLEEFYNADSDKESICGSIMATEHQIMCSNTGFYIKTKYNDDWTYQGEAELDTFRRLITEIYPIGGVSIVSDTWSLPKVVTELLPALKAEILARDGFVVIRPDSFWTNPQDCMCGFDGYHEKMDALNEAEIISVRKGLVESLYDLFGGTINSKGMKVLNPKIGSIYGDGMSLDRLEEICERLYKKGFASSNWVAGLGSYFYQYTTRDYFGFAQKCTYVQFTNDKGEKIGIDVFKDPITDDGTKKSAKGLIMVYKDENGELKMKDQCTWEEFYSDKNEFKLTFKNGVLVKETSLTEIKERLSKYNY